MLLQDRRQQKYHRNTDILSNAFLLETQFTPSIPFAYATNQLRQLAGLAAPSQITSIPGRSATMKLNISFSIALVALFCNVSNAMKTLTGHDDVVFEDLPSHIEVGQQVKGSWFTPRDYVRVIPPTCLLRWIQNYHRAPEPIRPTPESGRSQPLQVRRPHQKARAQHPTHVGNRKRQQHHNLDNSQCAERSKVSHTNNLPV